MGNRTRLDAEAAIHLYVVDPDAGASLERLVDTMTRLLRECVVAMATGCSARQHQRREVDLDPMARRLERFYEDRAHRVPITAQP